MALRMLFGLVLLLALLCHGSGSLSRWTDAQSSSGRETSAHSRRGARLCGHSQHLFAPCLAARGACELAFAALRLPQIGRKLRVKGTRITTQEFQLSRAHPWHYGPRKMPPRDSKLCLSPDDPAPPAAAASQPLAEIAWNDSLFDRFLQRILEKRIIIALQPTTDAGTLSPGDASVTAEARNGGSATSARLAHKGSTYHAVPTLRGHQGGHEEYDAMIRAALLLSRKPARDTRARTLSLLYDLFPSWFPQVKRPESDL